MLVPTKIYQFEIENKVYNPSQTLFSIAHRPVFDL